MRIRASAVARYELHIFVSFIDSLVDCSSREFILCLYPKFHLGKSGDDLDQYTPYTQGHEAGSKSDSSLRPRT